VAQVYRLQDERDAWEREAGAAARRCEEERLRNTAAEDELEMLREKVGDAYREGLFVKEQVRVCLPDSLSIACLRRQSRDSTREFSQPLEP
jgi:hypothetical protein